MTLGLIDIGGRRTGIDRRDFSYTNYLPNRRIGEDRRHGDDRRRGFREKKRFRSKNRAIPFSKKYNGRKTI